MMKQNRFYHCLLLSLCFCLGVGQALSQTLPSPSQRVYQAYIQQDAPLWKAVIDEQEARPQLTESELLDLLNFEYGYVAWCMSENLRDKNQAAAYLDKAYDNLEEVERLGGHEALCQAYRAAFIGYQIGIHPIKAPFIGLKSKRHLQKAEQLDSLHYFVQLQKGNILYYMPAAFGGSKSLGRQCFLRAQSLMQEAQLQKENWMYMNLLLTLADAYKHAQDYDQVEAIYQEILKVEPAYSYVKDQLVPGLENIRAKAALSKE